MIALSSRFSIDCKSLWIYSAPKVNANAYPDGKIRGVILFWFRVSTSNQSNRTFTN